MVTDHLLIRRAAAELDRLLAGARVRDVGLTDRGDFGIVFTGRTGAQALVVAPFGTPPLLWLEPETELALAGEPGWTRALGSVLRGLVVGSVRARKGDRVVALDFGARSRFGVATSSRLVIELVPRFGNVLLLKGERIVSAAKTFSPAENPSRSVQIGGTYAPPPERVGDRPPRLVEESLRIAGRTCDLEHAAAAMEPVHVYRRDGALVQAHLIPLEQFADLEHSREPALLPLLREAAHAAGRRGRTAAAESRRAGLVRSLQRRLEALDEQLARLRARSADAAERQRLREAGEAIYAGLHELPESERAGAKAEAARYFARYRKDADATPHLQRRAAALERRRAEIETLVWETQRADAEALLEIAADLEGVPAPRRVRKPVPLELASGARIYVGRSPRENAEITFMLARPDDLWFHARNAPGAHVVLVPPPGAPAAEADIARAAALAAGHSRARSSASADVDYTRRKYVRKQRGAAPGMVWYTDFKTIRIAPASS